ncbi:RNA-directed DNA polymerase [Parashewanella spongiae]|uniref:RNA-directed DNA polymerase n=1 Tax=Parashewanella spongiae TaxID=342950 RepID=A0A3A6TXH3_9GAMM|nr:reverse transcriptase family protein [Parashewanella spongiae]MCL1076927.1 reverse transcriptase family protein [Parashewanella spongiae]RJY19177.1 RNA-directed DNA polymerase [Parashewanella spongiae]USN27170.1 reverse transcriptase family protein [synthetic construct]
MNAAPLLVSFDTLKKFLDALPEKHRKSYQQQIEKLFTQSLPPSVSETCLAVLFGYSVDFVYALSKKQHKFYRSFKIKQGKKVRIIHSPRVALKVVQKWLGTHLSNAISFEPHVCGFVKGKSFADAAKIHQGARWVYSVDIENFFPSITVVQISGALEKLGYSEESAKFLANICSLNGTLAQGSPASPVISNIIMKDIDQRLIELAEKYVLKVSRYADDIVFSGKEPFSTDIPNELSSIFGLTPFLLNKNKAYFADSQKGQRLKVHGLLVKEDKILLTKGYRNKIRAFRHMVAQGKVSEGDLPRLKGHLTFAEFIERNNQV